MNRCMAWLCIAVCLCCFAAGCGGGGGGLRGSADSGLAITGTVTAPSGVSLGRAASASGLGAKASVTVQAYMIDDAGNKSGATLATAVTGSTGAFTLTLPAGVNPGSSLIISVGTGGNIMRAIAADATADISPITELVAQKVIASAQPLSSFTLAELDSMTAQVEADSAGVDLSASTTVSAAVASMDTGTLSTNINAMVTQAGAGTFQAGCGNSVVEGSETCDDGNTTSGDGCSSTCAAEPSRIVYNSWVSSGNRKIISSAYDGTDKTDLTDTSSDSFAPEWSPDGSAIAFCSKRTGDTNAGLYKMSRSGASVTKLKEAAGEDCLSADWKRTGDKIVFSTYNKTSHGDNVYVVNADGSGSVTIPGGRSPAWSSDGSKIYYNDSNDQNKLKTINPDGTGAAVVGSRSSYVVAISPDGTRALIIDFDVPSSMVTGAQAAVSGLFHAAVSMSGPFTLIREDNTSTNYVWYGDGGADWSPDGLKVVYDKNSASEHKVFISNIDGSGETLLADGAESPDWEW